MVMWCHPYIGILKRAYRSWWQLNSWPWSHEVPELIFLSSNLMLSNVARLLRRRCDHFGGCGNRWRKIRSLL
jgi:hypothetical protein